MQLNTKALKDVETSQPLIEDGTYHARMSAELKPNKQNTGSNLVLTHEIIDPANNKQTGEPVTRSIKLTRYVSMVDTDKYDHNENCKRLSDAIGLPDDADLTLEDLAGAVCQVQVVTSPERTDSVTGNTYPEANDVKAWMPKDEDFVAAGM